MNRVRELIAAPIVAFFGMAVSESIDMSLTMMDLRDAQANHARFEGTWTPHEARMQKISREREQLEIKLSQSETNHAKAEGAPERPYAAG